MRNDYTYIVSRSKSYSE